MWWLECGAVYPGRDPAPVRLRNTKRSRFLAVAVAAVRCLGVAPVRPPHLGQGGPPAGVVSIDCLRSFDQDSRRFVDGGVSGSRHSGIGQRTGDTLFQSRNGERHAALPNMPTLSEVRQRGHALHREGALRVLLLLRGMRARMAPQRSALSGSRDRNGLAKRFPVVHLSSR